MLDEARAVGRSLNRIAGKTALPQNRARVCALLARTLVPTVTMEARNCWPPATTDPFPVNRGNFYRPEYLYNDRQIILAPVSKITLWAS